MPKLNEVGPTVRVVVAATPVPLTTTDAGELGALLATLILPFVLPALCGAYSTLKELLCPTAIVNGIVAPLTLMPAPVEPNCVTVKLAVPVFVIVTGCDLDWPSTRLPKLMLTGETLIPGCTPVPDSANPGATPGASLVMPTVPPTIPVAVGANVTCSSAVWPAAKVAGVAKPASLNPEPEAKTCEMCTAACPVFVTVADRAELPPTRTFPNVSVEGFTVRCPTGALVPVPDSPMVVGEAGSLLTIEMLPLSAPTAVGANVTPITAD